MIVDSERQKIIRRWRADRPKHRMLWLPCVHLKTAGPEAQVIMSLELKERCLRFSYRSRSAVIENYFFFLVPLRHLVVFFSAFSFHECSYSYRSCVDGEFSIWLIFKIKAAASDYNDWYVIAESK